MEFNALEHIVYCTPSKSNALFKLKNTRKENLKNLAIQIDKEEAMNIIKYLILIIETMKLEGEKKKAALIQVYKKILKQYTSFTDEEIQTFLKLADQVVETAFFIRDRLRESDWKIIKNKIKENCCCCK